MPREERIWGQVEEWNHKDTQEICRGDVIFIILITMMVLQMYTYVKAYQLILNMCSLLSCQSPWIRFLKIGIEFLRLYRTSKALYCAKEKLWSDFNYSKIRDQQNNTIGQIQPCQFFYEWSNHRLLFLPQAINSYQKDKTKK